MIDDCLSRVLLNNVRCLNEVTDDLIDPLSFIDIATDY